MAKEYGVEYPERELMAVLSDLLGIEHFTTSKGSSVRTDFLAAVAVRLGIDPGKYHRNKDGLLMEIARIATQADPDPTVILSPGGTVKNSTLQIIIDGVVKHHQLGPAGPGGGPLVPVAPVPAVDAPPAQDPALPTGQDALDLPIKTLEDLLDPGHGLDPDDRRLLAIAYREGQDAFRKAVLEAYKQSSHEACCITGHGPPQVLEAAHIVPYASGGVSTVDNGLCLRRDLHRLFDRRLVAIHEGTLTVLVHPVLITVPVYAGLAGQKIHVPNALADRPAPAALKAHRLACGL